MPIAGALALVNLTFIVVGGFIYSGGFLGFDTQYGYGWDKTRVGLIVLAVSLLLWIIRTAVQDKKPLRLREDTPTMPPEEVRAPTRLPPLRPADRPIRASAPSGADPRSRAGSACGAPGGRR